MWQKSNPVRLFALVIAASAGGASCGPNTTDPHATSDVRAQACANCHLTAYTLTANPVHANVFPKTCETCHTTQAWIPGTVPAPLHPKFTLDGAHANTACAQCHPGSPARYAGTPTTCSTCHAGDFQRASAVIPGHDTFPMACDGCHTTSAWNPTLSGMGNHPESLFPITKGSHANAAIACTDCHIASRGAPTKGQNCDCIHCHLGGHDEPAIDSIHASVSGYKATTASAPNACLGCHSAG
jgi:hypothetical protein